MTIKRDRKRPQRFPITAYDFEWRSIEAGSGVKTHAVTLCGAYDERGYRYYQSTELFLTNEMVPGNAGRRYYAHFGGASDMVFLLRELARLPKRYRTTGAFSGSSAIFVQVKDSENEDRQWQFIDSFWTMRVPLATIGQWLGRPKGKVSFEDASLAELRDYNEQDCRILYEALHKVQDTLIEEGGELGITAAATAMKTFLKVFMQKPPIKNSERLNNASRGAYSSSRVEVIRKSCQRASYYDINSSFPWSYTQPVPGSAIGFRNGGPLPSGGLWIADVDVDIPEDTYLPAVPFRTRDNRVFFPVGKMRTWITSEDYATGLTVSKVHMYIRFEGREDMAGFAHHFFEKRKAGGFESQVYKILLNSLYGKFAENGEKDVLLIHPEERDLDEDWMVAPGIYIRPIVRRVPHAHVPIAAMITSRSRRLLLEHMRMAHARGRVYYCDTDSVICDAELETSAELGGLKREKYEIREGVFVASKTYGFRHGGDGEDLEDYVRAKGFSRIVGGGKNESQRINYETFARLAIGEPVKVERMLRIRELLREGAGGEYIPRTEIRDKQLRGPMPKRCHLPGGDSRPWNVLELEEG